MQLEILNNQLSESETRCSVASEAVEAALERLNEALAKGRDTSLCRRAAEEATNLLDQAIAARGDINQKIESIIQTENASVAIDLLAAAQACIDEVLKPFDLKKCEKSWS